MTLANLIIALGVGWFVAMAAVLFAVALGSPEGRR